MNLTNPFQKLNWRLLLIHVVACWLFAYAFNSLFLLHDYTFIKTLRQNGLKRPYDSDRLTNDILWISFGSLVGLLVSFSISLLIVIKNKWHWINCIVILLVVFFLETLDIGWPYLKHIFLAPGGLVKSEIAYFLINGAVMLSLGTLLFLLKSIRQFINSNVEHQTVASL
jgi:hypothetical protein